MNPPEIIAVFVYGTLKRGQCRETCWPLTPSSIVSAWTRGTLFGRSDYPAMTPGTDRVSGELWTFSSDGIARVLAVLDEVEEAPDLYQRVAVPVFDMDQRTLGIAWTYLYATEPTTDGFTPLKPCPSDWVRWESRE
jgi:gamma-glutamylcyclotransferase (GGCT)/AIG2-like uncharacterized protein YtfP